MSVHFDPDRKKWRAQIDGFPVPPKKRSRRTETKHEAQIEEHKLRAERDRLLNEAKQGKIFEKLAEYAAWAWVRVSQSSDATNDSSLEGFKAIETNQAELGALKRIIGAGH